MKKFTFVVLVLACSAMGVLSIRAAFADGGSHSGDLVFRDRNYTIRLEIVGYKVGSDVEFYVEELPYVPSDPDFEGSIQATPNHGHIGVNGRSYPFESVPTVSGGLMVRIPYSEFDKPRVRVAMWVVDEQDVDLWDDSYTITR